MSTFGKQHRVLNNAALVNHLAQGARFEPIYDPEAFMAAYIARYQGEVPEDEQRPGVTRLHGFGLPDFAALRRPRMEGDTLIFRSEERRVVKSCVSTCRAQWSTYL